MENNTEALVEGLKRERNRLKQKYPAVEDHGIIRNLEERIAYLERDLELSKNKVDKQLSG